eukprot:7998934-Pyramimonas_sp.AAC.1
MRLDLFPRRSHSRLMRQLNALTEGPPQVAVGQAPSTEGIKQAVDGATAHPARHSLLLGGMQRQAQEIVARPRRVNTAAVQ